MEHLIAPAGLNALDQALRGSPVLGLAFDGTIAPEVADPCGAEVPIEISQRLAQLSNQLPKSR